MTLRTVHILLAAILATATLSPAASDDDGHGDTPTADRHDVATDDRPIDLGPAEGEKPATPSTAPADKPSNEKPAKESPAAEAGRIEGAILPADRVKSVKLVNRDAGLSRPAAYDRASGKFVAEHLPVGVWAVEIETPWGRIEGLDARYRPAELARAAPKKPGELAVVAPPLDDEDKAEITGHITAPERFMTARALMFVGDGRQATVVVSLLRDQGFHSDQGDEAIWRLETWYYADQWGHWERLGGKVVFRERLPGAEFRKWTRQFEPALGGLEITDRTSAPLTVSYTVPELPSRSKGLVAAGQKAADDPPPEPKPESPAKPSAPPPPAP